MNIKNYKGFTLIELLVVITIITILTTISVPAIMGVQQRAARLKSLSNIRSIVQALRNFDSENDFMPSYDIDSTDKSLFKTSTQAFNLLIPEYVDQESIFWTKVKDPTKLIPPDENGELKKSENVYCYVIGLSSNSDYSKSPIVADGLMVSPGKYGQYHPYLKQKRALVGFLGGTVSEMRLTSNSVGATIKNKTGNVKDIFKQRVVNSSGKSSGGWLDTSPKNVLLP